MNRGGKRRTDNSNRHGALRTILKGSIVGTVAESLLLILFAAFLLKGGLPVSTYVAVMISIVSVACFFAGFSAVRPNRVKGIANGAAAAFPVIIITLIVCCIVSHGAVGKRALLASFAGLLSGSMGGIAAVNMKSKKRKKI